MALPRVVSLLPSTTEIACALGFREALVGRSHECDHPAGVGALPALTQPKLDPSRASAVIDADVKRLVGEGLSVYRVDAERLRALAPDVILTQDQCEVCAASPADLECALEEWTGARPRIVSLAPTRLADVLGDVQRVASALAAPERGRELAGRMTERIAELGERSRDLAARPRVACIEWIDPLMAAGHWMPELVALAGGEPVFGAAGEPSPWLAWDELAAADPDVLAILPCGFDLARTRREIPPLAEREGFAALRAARAGSVFLADGNAYFNRPGPRLVASLEILCEMLHPAAFPAVHRGRAWVELPR